jgi:hypothetical protein
VDGGGEEDGEEWAAPFERSVSSAASTSSPVSVEASATRACWMVNHISTILLRMCGGGEMEEGPFLFVWREVWFEDDDDE